MQKAADTPYTIIMLLHLPTHVSIVLGTTLPALE